MTNSRQHQGWISRIGLRAVSAAMALATMLMLSALTSQPAQAQTFTVLYSFMGGTDGAYPYAGVTLDAEGNLYGTTVNGGGGCGGFAPGCGTVWELSSTGTEKVLHHFKKYTDGNLPYGGLMRDAAGNLYGTTSHGAYYGKTGIGGCSSHHGCGAIFKLDTSGKETLLFKFDKYDGRAPGGGLVTDAAGNFYGSDTLGGEAIGCGWGCGTVFELGPSGTETTLHKFNERKGEGLDPWGDLVRDKAGNLYGTASGASPWGNQDDGTIFKIDAAGKETVLYKFAGPDGETPYAGLIRDAAGNFYGTTVSGGAYGYGVVFKLDATGTESVLYSFTGGADGGNPYAPLISDTAGNLYGTTFSGGGTANAGTVFELNTSGTETVLYTFTGGSDGAGPYAGLSQDAAGNFYGTTWSGGAYGYGVVFKIAPH